MKEKGIRLVGAQVFDDVREGSRYKLRQLYGGDAFDDALDEAVKDYKKQTG